MNARSLAQVLLLSLAVSTRLWAAGSPEVAASPPQTIVIGTTILSGSGNEVKLGRLVATALARPAGAAITIAIHVAPSADRMAVRVAVEPVRKNTEVLLALVESHGAQEADAVREYAQLPSHGGTADLSISSGMKLANVRVVALVQNVGSLQIIGANQSMPLARVSPRSSTVNGAILSSRGAGLPRALIEVCSDTLCIPTKSNEQGRFTLPQVPSGSYTVKFYPSGSPTGTPLSLPLIVEKGEQVTLPAVVAGS